MIPKSSEQCGYDNVDDRVSPSSSGMNVIGVVVHRVRRGKSERAQARIDFSVKLNRISSGFVYRCRGS